MRNSFNADWTFKRVGDEVKVPVQLPHDAMFSEKRTPEAKGASASGYFPGGSYIYEKELDVPAEWLTKHITLEFEGVYKNAKVYVNEKEAGGTAYGYIPFFVVLDGFLKEGTNIIRVEADNSAQPDSRWYSGAGIYRPVWLHVQEKCHLEIEGIQIKTLSVDPARIRVTTAHEGGQAQVEILDGDRVITGVAGDAVELDIPDAKLWSAEMPYLYTAKVTLTEDGQTVETACEYFGIRQITWDNKGFYVNGKETLLKGGCIHHDNGILGACAYPESDERRIRIMKEAGFNAIRCAHNPCSKATLEACDRYGMYVMDETWDMWYQKKSPFDYANEFMAYYKDDIRAMIRRDFNHPSVIMYSIGNEVSEPATEKGVNLAKEMIALCHSLDDSRPVTGGFNLMIIGNAAKGKAIYKEDGGRDESGEAKMNGMNSTMFNMITSMIGTGMNKAANSKKVDEITTPVLDSLDMAGYNYASGRYPLEAKAHPDRLIFGSETFPQDIAKNWAMVEQYPYLIGDFMWTAWDYLGEAGIGAWAYTSDAKGFNKPYPWLLADTGAFDILGNPNGEALLAQATWGTAQDIYLAVQPINHPEMKPIKAAWRGTNSLPSWSWKNCEGNKAVVEVFSKADSVELLLNGTSLGRKKTKLNKVVFKVKYEAGTLVAIAYDARGRECGRDELRSATGKLQIQITPEKTNVVVGELVYMDINIADADGVVEMNADTALNVSVENGELLAFGSANPRTDECFTDGSYTTYYGRSQAVIRAKKAGDILVTVSGKGYDTVTGKITCK